MSRCGKASARLRFDPEDRLSEQDYLAFCRLNPDLRVERSAEGEILIGIFLPQYGR